MRFCVICKQPIELERSEAIPETRLCAQHGKQIQQYGGEFILSSAQERTSKQGSLKMNYGGVVTQQTRNQEALEKLQDAYEFEQFGE